nr:exocyst complex component SEC15B [Tanacetum cinerariifolium]
MCFIIKVGLNTRSKPRAFNADLRGLHIPNFDTSHLAVVMVVDCGFFWKFVILTEGAMLIKNLGQVAIGQASAGRQREEELRIRQRQAEEQRRLSVRDTVYALEEEEEDNGVVNGGDGGDVGGGGALGFDSTSLYRSYHTHQTLGLEDGFKKYYFENRKLQLTSDFQDRVLRTGGGLINKMEVENLWDTALISTSISGFNQAILVAANMAVLEWACNFFFRHSTKLSRIPLRMVERSSGGFSLTKACDAAEDMLSSFLKKKVDGFMTLIKNVKWMIDEPPQNENEYVNKVINFLETLLSTTQQILSATG